MAAPADLRPARVALTLTPSVSWHRGVRAWRPLVLFAVGALAFSSAALPIALAVDQLSPAPVVLPATGNQSPISQLVCEPVPGAAAVPVVKKKVKPKPRPPGEPVKPKTPPKPGVKKKPKPKFAMVRDKEVCHQVVMVGDLDLGALPTFEGPDLEPTPEPVPPVETPPDSYPPYYIPPYGGSSGGYCCAGSSGGGSSGGGSSGGGSSGGGSSGGGSSGGGSSGGGSSGGGSSGGHPIPEPIGTGLLGLGLVPVVWAAARRRRGSGSRP